MVRLSWHIAQNDSCFRQYDATMCNMTDIDSIDRQILSLLGGNARMPVAKLAAQLGIARTTVQARLDRLERSGVIAGYTLRLSDSVHAGMIRATVLINIKPSAQTAVLTHLRHLPAVEKVHTTSGRFDLACQLRTTSTLELDETLDRIGAIAGVESSESLIHLSTRIDRAV
jgi:DNA-binding Lrp family transcriptional regulator